MREKQPDSSQGRPGPSKVLLRDIRSQYGEYQTRVRGLIKQGLEKQVTQVSLALVGTLALVALLALLALRPTLLTISELIREIQDEERVIEALDRKISALQAAEQTLRELEERLYLLYDAIPSGFNVELLAKELELLAADRGLAMIEFSQEGFFLRRPDTAADQASGVAALPISLSVGGREESIRSFISDLENLDRLVVVDFVLMSSVTEKDREDQPYPVRATIGVDVYYQRT